MATAEIVKLINTEDHQVTAALAEPKVQQAITEVVDDIVAQFKAGGRLFYIGAGTSGRLGVLDAAECVPTFGTDPEMVQGLIAGGERAMTVAVEGAEDNPELGARDLKAHQLTEKDFVLGIAASGTTPYVVGGLDFAREIGAKTGALSCNANALISEHAQRAIEVVVGPEVVTGSTRMKAGTAQKLVLNTISTTAMIRMGKVFENLMVDVKPTNIKLIDRAKRIIQEATGVSYDEATVYFEKANQRPKTAIVMILAGVDVERAELLLEEHEGRIGDIIENLRK